MAIIKKATTETGIPIQINPFSLEMLGMNSKKGAMQEILSSRIQQFYRTSEYEKLDEKFRTFCDEIRNDVPECKKIINEIDDLVVGKEVQLFDEGYRAGIADLITALTFNELQITHTEVIDFEEIDKIRELKVNKAEDIAV